MDRRDFMMMGGLFAGSLGLDRLLPARATQGAPAMRHVQNRNSANAHVPADFTLDIGPVVVELAPGRNISTIGYNGTSPGPLIRVREGRPIIIDVANHTDSPELVHWHGQLIPSEEDGAEEEGTPMIPPRGRSRYQFRPGPAGSRWYHTHAMAGSDLHRGTYTGQYGFFYIESGKDLGQYDQEHFLALRDWEPILANKDEDDDGQDPNVPMPEKPARMPDGSNGYEAVYRFLSFNDKVMGAGPPIQVKQGDRVLFHFLNACATSNRRIAMTGHRFKIFALDGNPVPNPQAVDVIVMGPGERVDCFVDMNQPGVWALGAIGAAERSAGLGIIVQYENQKGQPQFLWPANRAWDYTFFGAPTAPPAPPQTIDMIFEKIPGGAEGFNHWTINGKEYPHGDEFVLRPGHKYRIFFRNRTDDDHPVHIHRHLFEVVEINGKPTGGIMKDTVVVPQFGRVAVDLLADQPGLTLFHCHNQMHMDFGFKALFRYS